MKKLISFLLSCSLLVMAASTSIFAKEKTIPEEIILYETEMKSEQELIKDALTGKKDSGLKVHIKSEVINDNGKRQNVNINYSYTVQKLKEVKSGNEITSSYVIYATTDPTDYDKRDRNENPGLNFRQTIWGWFDKVSYGAALEYGKATRYEARWELLDSNRLTIEKGQFVAKSEGEKMNGQYLYERSPSSYYPPRWGSQYAKPLSWDYVKISDQVGYAGAVIATDYKAGSTSSTLYTTIGIGNVPLPIDFIRIPNN